LMTEVYPQNWFSLGLRQTGGLAERGGLRIHFHKTPINTGHFDDASALAIALL
jgi:hypothetical protein